MVESAEIKEQVKEALVEFLKEDNLVLRGIITDVMEDIALGKAIEAGDVGDFVDEKLIVDMLNKDN
jgi:hypothetical protein